MEVFDKVSQQTVDRRDRHLSILALVMVVILGGGMALLMYPTVFGKAAVIPVAPSKTLFYRFCALCMLMVVYLVNRMFVVQNLRASLVEEREQLAQVLQQSSAELLGTLLGFSHFQDRLTMDFRRAAQIEGAALAAVGARQPFEAFHPGPQAQVALGDAAKVLSRKLRVEDSLYRLSSEVFGIVLPGVTDAAGERDCQSSFGWTGRRFRRQQSLYRGYPGGELPGARELSFGIGTPRFRGGGRGLTGSTADALGGKAARTPFGHAKGKK